MLECISDQQKSIYQADLVMIHPVQCHNKPVTTPPSTRDLTIDVRVKQCECGPLVVCAPGPARAPVSTAGELCLL